MPTEPARLDVPRWWGASQRIIDCALQPFPFCVDDEQWIAVTTHDYIGASRATGKVIGDQIVVSRTCS